LRGNQLLPAISSGKTELAFISDAAGRADLFIKQYNTERKTKPRQLFSYPGASNASPSFSPDGKIAFVSDKTGTPRIYIIDLLHKHPPMLLTRKHVENTCPSWSPDGKKIAYIAKVEGVRQIWIYDLITKQESALTRGGFNKENSVWAPDNLHIYFNSVDKKQTQLYMLHINHPNPIQITFGAGEKKISRL